MPERSDISHPTLEVAVPDAECVRCHRRDYGSGVATNLPHFFGLLYRISNSIRNLWPESNHTSSWNSYVKHALERKLHKLACAGKLDLETAQSEIASNCVEAYQKYVSETPPAPRVQETKPAPAT